ncbi:MAG: MBL fold metallo-hydrolase [Acetobacterium sp.]|nr:MBL fold metallo-hydrolase [Acetobacterium sp.]
MSLSPLFFLNFDNCIKEIYNSCRIVVFGTGRLSKGEFELRTKPVIGVIRLNMNLIREFVDKYKETYTYENQKIMYEEYLKKAKDEAVTELIPFFEKINNLFLRKKVDEKLLFEDSAFKDLDVEEQELLKGLGRYFEARRLVLIKKNEEAADMLDMEGMLDEKINLTHALLWTVEGDALFARGKKNDIDRAESRFRKAIQLEDKYASAHLGLAIALFKRNSNIYNEEMEKALETAEKLGAKAQVAEQRGFMNQQYGKIKEAVSFYEEAIKYDPCMLIALRFLAPYYCDIMDNDVALNNFKKVKTIMPDDEALNILDKANNIMPDDDPDINFLKGLVLLKKGERESNSKQAEEYLKKARNRYKVLNSKFYQSFSDELLKEIEVDTQTRENLMSNPNSVAKILWQTIEKKIDYTVFHNKEKFLDFIAPKLSETVSQKIEFEVLRRWNSYTPIIADNHFASKGGGYFINIKGKGIVVDPGFNFIDNFREAGHKFHEIDAVLITHAHNDHTADLESILTLLHKYNKELEGEETFNRDNTIRADMAMFNNKSIRCGEKEEDIEFVKNCKEEFERRKKIIDLFLTKSTLDKYNGLLSLQADNYRIHVIEAKFDGVQQNDKNYANCDQIKFNASSIIIGDDDEKNCVHIQVIPAKHDDLISLRDSVGFVFEFTETNSILIITGDTGWSKEIKEQYFKLSKDYKEKGYKIILVAHLGGFYEKEIEYDPNPYPDAEITSPPFYKHHLGRLGLASLLETLKPDYCFISEFGEEFKGKRINLANIFDEVFKDTVILPVDNGFKYDVVNDKVNVITKEDPDSCQNEYGYVDLKDVKAHKSKDDSLQYYYQSRLLKMLRRNWNMN